MLIRCSGGCEEVDLIVELAVLMCLRAPVPGEVVAPFAPIGRYEGHWGVDLAANYGSPVRAAGSGVVTFAGSVAGMWSVTIDHGDGLRSSVSYLSEILVEDGARVGAGEAVGSSGMHHGVEALHFSVRVDGQYTDPLPYLLCGAGDPRRLYLLPPPDRGLAKSRHTRGNRPGRLGSYPRRCAQRPTWGNLRSSSHRPSPGGRGRLPPVGA